jgi:hypothetical protein
MGVLIKSEKIAIMKSAVLNFFNMLLGMKRWERKKWERKE